MPSGGQGWALVLQLKTNRGDCDYQTCAITPECAVAAEFAPETESVGSESAIPTAAGSGQKPGLLGLDSDTSMRRVLESERWSDCNRSRPHQRLGRSRNESEDHRLLGDPALFGASPGEFGFVPFVGREGVFASARNRRGRPRASTAEPVLAARDIYPIRRSSGGNGGVRPRLAHGLAERKAMPLYTGGTRAATSICW
jgi:hypothetical protein